MAEMLYNCRCTVLCAHFINDRNNLLNAPALPGLLLRRDAADESLNTRDDSEMIQFEETGWLQNALIDEWSEKAIQAYQEAAGKRAADTTTLRLSIEELLLRFRDVYGTEEPCRIRCLKRINGIFFELSQKGIQNNPLDISQEMSYSHDILAMMNINPSYVYRVSGNRNVVTIPAPLKPQKHTMLLSLLFAVLLALGTWGIAGILPESICTEYMIPMVSSLFKKFSAVFSALATPLVFCAVISGIKGLGSAASFGRLGGILLRRMLGTYLIAGAAMVAFGLPMGLVSLKSSEGGTNVFNDLLKLVLDIIPGNLLEPFTSDNDLQVIVIAIFIGIVMMILGERVHHISVLIDEAGLLINRMMQMVCKFLPIFVYLGISNLLLSGQLAGLAQVSKIAVISLAGIIVTVGITLCRALVMTKIPFRTLFSAQLPSLLINLTTSSQVSALPESMKCCKEKWHIDEKFVDFGLPIGMVVYMPNGAIMLGSIVWVLASIAGGSVDPATLTKLVFVAIIIAIAAPPIPGSAFAVLPILFSSVGLDLSLMPLAVIVGSTIGYLLPAVNGYCLQLELLMTAWKAGCMNKQNPSANG